MWFAHLSSAVVSQQCENLIFVHAEAEVVDGHLLAERLAELVHHHRRRASEGLVHLLDGDGDRGGGTILDTAGGRHVNILELYVVLGEPVAGHDWEVPRLGYSHLGVPHLREVPGGNGVDEHVGDHDAADGADADAIVGLQEGAGADLKGDGRNQAADDLGGLVGNGGRIHSEDHDIDDEESCMDNINN